MITYWYSTGHARNMRAVLARTLAAYARRADWIKIGITRTPEARFYNHQREWPEGEEWKRMVVIYQSSSWRSVCAVEDELIQYARETSWRDKLWNQRAGGGGCPPRYDGPYWVYLLIG